MKTGSRPVERAQGKRKMDGGAAPARAVNKMKRSISIQKADFGASARAATSSDQGSSDEADDSGLGLPLSVIKGLRRKSSNGGTGSNGSNGGGSGNNSDNSALVSLGNNSFGFNFDSEEAMLSNSGSSPNNSDPYGKDGEGVGSDSDHGCGARAAVDVTASSTTGGSTSAGCGKVPAEASGASSAFRADGLLSPAARASAIKAEEASAAGARRADKANARAAAERQQRQNQHQNQHQNMSVPMPKPSPSSLHCHRSGSGSSDSGSGDGGESGGDSGSGSGGSSGTNGNGGSRSSAKSTVSSLTMSSNSNGNESRPSHAHFSNDNSPGSHEEAAAAAVAHLQSIASSYTPQKMVSNETPKAQVRMPARPSAQSKKSSLGSKRKAAKEEREEDEDYDDDDDDNDSAGYNSDDEGNVAASRGGAAPLECAPAAASRAAPDAGSCSAGAAAMAASKQAAVVAAAAQAQLQLQAQAGNFPPPFPQQQHILPASLLHQASSVPSTPMIPPQSMTRDDTSTGDPASAALSPSLSAPLQDSPASSPGHSGKKQGKKILDDAKREERNAREKERSFRISRQINDLRNLLSSGGVIVPKGTKSAVLTEAANYIRMLQQHQYRSEIDRHQLVQQMQIIGSGALGPQAATAIRHVAAQNGVWSLGNFGGVPPRSAMTYYQQSPYGGSPGIASVDSSQQSPAPPQQAQPQPLPQTMPQPQNRQDPQLATKIDDHEYRYVFNSCSVGMAIASMGGAFIDCNSLFCQLSQYTKQEVCGMTIFNLTSRQDLQHAFDLISKMISPPPDGSNQNPPPCVLRGAMKHRNDLGLSIALIKGEDGIAKCFCVTLIKNPASPFDTSRPIPATADFLQPGGMQLAQAVTDDAQKNQSSGSYSSPAYTTG